MGIESGLMRDRFAWVLGCAGQDERLGPVEGGGFADLACLLALDLEGRLCE